MMAGVEAIHSVTGAIDMIVCVAAEHVDGIEKARVDWPGLPGSPKCRRMSFWSVSWDEGAIAGKLSIC